jgi:hypothetical protein
MLKFKIGVPCARAWNEATKSTKEVSARIRISLPVVFDVGRTKGIQKDSGVDERGQQRLGEWRASDWASLVMAIVQLRFGLPPAFRPFAHS